MRNVLPLNVDGDVHGHARALRQRGHALRSRRREDDLGPADRAARPRSPASSAARSRPARRRARSTGSACSITASRRRWPSSAWRPTASAASARCRSATRPERHGRPDTRSATADRPGADCPAGHLCLAGLRAHLRAAHLRLHGAAGAERRLSAAQGGMGAQRRPARRAGGRRRPDGRPAHLSAVAARRPLGPDPQPDRDGGAVEPRDLALRHGARSTSRCSPAGSSSASARPPMAASASPSSSASFPRAMRATLSAAFMAGGLVGQVLGVGARRRDRRRPTAGARPSSRSPWPACVIAIALSAGRARAPDRRAAPSARQRRRRRDRRAAAR